MKSQILLLPCALAKLLPTPPINFPTGRLLEGDFDLTRHTEARELILSVHNQWRSDLARGITYRGVYGKNVNQLVWDEDLARSSQIYADLCTFTHSEKQDPPFTVLDMVYGENLAVSSTTADLNYRDFDGVLKALLEDRMASWANEYKDFPMGSDGVFRSDRGFTCPHGVQCNHYTAMTWAENMKVGCGFAKCDTVEDTGVDLFG